MQRKATKNTRAANADEKRFMAWVKWQDCCVCGVSGPSVVDHCYGSAFKHNKTLIGHFFVIPLCTTCDAVDTQGSRRAFVDKFGPKSEYWLKIYDRAPVSVPEEIVEAIKDWGR